MSTEHARYSSREEIQNEELTDEREAVFQEGFETCSFAPRIQQTVAASFTVDGDLSSNAAVLSGALDHDRIFPGIASYMASGDDKSRKASATVRDTATDAEIRADIVDGKVLISPRSEDVPYQTFRDYCLFLENRLGVTLTLT